jgi:sugar phosphate isomerase/epimerase
VLTEKIVRRFKLGTTSFIYPDHIVPNVKKLGHHFDEIELLIFESKPLAHLPTSAEIDELAKLSIELSVTYNVHLPTDISLASPSKTMRQDALDTLERVVTLAAPLCPTTHTLHLDLTFEEMVQGQDGILRFQERAIEGLELLAQRIPSPDKITIETLEYPPEILFPVLDATPIALCMDAGHLIRYGYDVSGLFERYGKRIPLIHFHGVDFSYDPPRDHQGLDRTPMDRVGTTLGVLEKFTGVVSLEVFNLDHLKASLDWMDRCFSLSAF